MFSVVVPIWNARSTLRRTVEHALAQTFGAFELILVDDGSIDGSLQAIAGLDDPRLRVITQANAGPGLARNRGVAEARHDWVAFLDADDLWLPDHLAELDRIRTAFPDAGLIGTRFITTDRRGRFRRRDPGPGLVERICLFDRIGRGEPTLHTSSAAAPTALLRQLGGFKDFPRGEDSELWAQIALGHPVARSTRETAVYIKGTNGITDTRPTAWGSGAPGRPEDISPALALVLERLPEIAEPGLRAAIERYVERYFDWTLRGAARTGDIATVRALPAFYRRPPPPLQRMAFAAATLPPRLALAAIRALLFAEAVVVRLSGRPRAFSSATGLARAAPRPSRSAA